LRHLGRKCIRYNNSSAVANAQVLELRRGEMGETFVCVVRKFVGAVRQANGVKFQLGHSEKGGGGNDWRTASVDGGMVSGVGKAGQVLLPVV
jgi:hypothetical protein